MASRLGRRLGRLAICKPVIIKRIGLLRRPTQKAKIRHHDLPAERAVMASAAASRRLRSRGVIDDPTELAIAVLPAASLTIANHNRLSARNRHGAATSALGPYRHRQR